MIRPTLDDLFRDKVCKYTQGVDTFYVPLWIDVNTFEDAHGQEITITSMPILPDNITIDDDNHIHVYVNDDPSTECVTVWSGLTVSIDELVNTVTVFPGAGIALRNVHDIYNVEQRGDVIFHRGNLRIAPSV